MKNTGYRQRRVITKQTKELAGDWAPLILFFLKPNGEGWETLIRGLQIKKVVEVSAKKAFLR